MTPVRGRITALQARRQSGLGRLAQCRAGYAGERKRVGVAKARIEAGGSVRGVIEELQRRQHARTVGAFEQLLSAFLRDVFGQAGAGGVVLDVYSRQGAPAMDVGIRKGAFVEDALDGNGGGVINVLSTGLRLIALTRSGRRPFIILDEPDCWLETGKIAAFAGVLQQVAAQLGVQVLFISHHDEKVLGAIPYHVKIDGAHHAIEAEASGAEQAWEPGQPGLRRVTLVDCYAHANATLRLVPGVTVLRGSNNAGKSALVAALRAALGEGGNDAMIRHGAPEARVTLDFENDASLRFTRTRHGSPKVKYELLSHKGGVETVLRTGTNAKQAPDWVFDTSGIGLVDGLDVQMADQKNPVFLLNQSAGQRARALAIGGEDSFVQAMAEADRIEVREAQAAVRHGEGELERLHRFIAALEPIESGQARWDALVAEGEAFEARQIAREEACGVLAQWRQVTQRRASLARGTGAVAPVPSVAGPAGRELVADLALHGKRAAALRTRMASASGKVPAAPRAPDMAATADAWRKQAMIAALRPRLGTLPAAPARPARDGAAIVARAHGCTVRMRALQRRLRIDCGGTPDPAGLAALRCLQDGRTASVRAEAARSAVQEARQEEVDATQAMRGVNCPTCGRPLLETDSHD